jgi:hypothetical protein
MWGTSVAFDLSCDENPYDQLSVAIGGRSGTGSRLSGSSAVANCLGFGMPIHPSA